MSKDPACCEKIYRDKADTFAKFGVRVTEIAAARAGFLGMGKRHGHYRASFCKKAAGACVTWKRSARIRALLQTDEDHAKALIAAEIIAKGNRDIEKTSYGPDGEDYCGVGSDVCLKLAKLGLNSTKDVLIRWMRASTCGVEEAALALGVVGDESVAEALATISKRWYHFPWGILALKRLGLDHHIARYSAEELAEAERDIASYKDEKLLQDLGYDLARLLPLRGDRT